MRSPRLLRVALALGGAALFAFGGEACSHSDALNFEPPADAAPTAFTADGSDGAAPDGGLTEYCPLLQCPYPYTTCPGSRFPCDVNLLTDVGNCGSCGFECPVSNADYSCNAGRCVPKCFQGTLDCNGIVDDGCEADIGTNQNCNGCGDVCADPGKPCIYDPFTNKGTCGCAVGLTLCNGDCVDLTADDSACGACDQACGAKAGDAGTPGPHEYYGCSASTCGHLKCRAGFADCDSASANGCEASLLTNTNCGACGKACPAGESCVENAQGQPECLCPPGQTLCGTNHCTDITTDPGNCGACGVSCLFAGQNQNGVGQCRYGSCEFHCLAGYGDCNGDPNDGCETNLGSDQNNCGACGNACDVFGGQPCVAGSCAVQPCGDAGIVR